MTRQISALVVGCGSIGSRHARNLSDLGIEVSLFDTDIGRAKSLASDCVAEVYPSLSSALEAEPDIAVVATPSNHHVEPAQRAAQAGCDIFVEKPLSNRTDGVVSLLDTVRESDLVSMVGCNLRFHPAIQTVAELLERDVIGKVTSARIHAGSYLPNWHPDQDNRELYAAKAGVGGAVLDYVHELNYARLLFGEPNSVSAMLGHNSSLDIETEDTAIIAAKFDELLCQIQVNYVQRPYSRSSQIVGEMGTIEWDWGDGVARRYDTERDCWTIESEFAEWEVNEMYRSEMEHFVECVESRTNPTTTLKDGLRDLKFALATKKSHERGEHVTV